MSDEPRKPQSEYAKLSKGCKDNRVEQRELVARVVEIADFILEHPLVSDFKIHEQFCQKFDIKWRQCDRYTARAKYLNQTRVRMSMEEARDLGDSVALKLLRSPNEKIVLGALRVWMERHGCMAAAKVALQNPDGTPLFIPMQIDPKDIIGDGLKKKE